MAVNISIPGIGMVQAENAATEATLRQLVQAMGAQQTRTRRADAEIAQSTKAQAGFADRAADSLEQVASSAKSSESAARGLFSNLQEGISRTTLVASDIKDSGLGTYLKQLGATAIEVSATWARNFGEIRSDPIKNASSLIATSIDAVSAGLSPMAKLFPGGEAGLRVLTAGFHTANAMLHKEITDTVKAVETFNRMGASFANGVSELRQAAFDSGLTVDQFTRSLKAADPQLKAMGITTAGAANRVADVMYSLGKQTNEAGTTLRNQLRGMGYGIEEQVELSAQYLALQRATMTAEKFAKLDNDKVAQGTRQYAEDLKVLADITGKNAKAAMEEARAKSMEADIMAQLSPEEAEKFQKAYAAMPEYAKKGFLEYVSSGGQAITDQATNIAMSQNKELEQLIKGSYANIKDAGKDASTIQTEVLKQVSAVGQEQQRITKEAGGGIIGMANRLGASGLDQISGMFNAMISSGLYTKDAVDKSSTNAKKMAELNDKLLEDLIKFEDNVQKQAVNMSTQLGPYIKAYTEALEKVTNAMNKFTILNVQAITGRAPPLTREGRLPPPGTEPTQAYGLDQYWKDMKSLFQQTLEPISDQVLKIIKGTPGHAKGGIAMGPESGHLAMLHGTEAVVPLDSGAIPVQLSGNSNTPDLSGMIQTMQQTYAAALNAAEKSSTINQEKMLSDKNQIKELPDALTAALTTVMSGPTGLTEIMTAVKNQITEDNRTQNSMLQQQIDNLVKLVDAMNDNVRYSERIANELG